MSESGEAELGEMDCLQTALARPGRSKAIAVQYSAQWDTRATSPMKQTTGSNRSGADTERRSVAAGLIPVACSESGMASTLFRRRNPEIRFHISPGSSLRTGRSDWRSEMVPGLRPEDLANDNSPASRQWSRKRSRKALPYLLLKPSRSKCGEAIHPTVSFVCWECYSGPKLLHRLSILPAQISAENGHPATGRQAPEPGN